MPRFYQTFQIEPVEPLALVADVTKQNSCFGDKKGQVNISWKGQNAIFNFSDKLGISTFSKIVGDNQEFSIDSLSMGDYTVWLSRNAGCNEKSATSFSITEPAPLRFDFVKQDIECYGKPTGLISGLISGGTGGYDWQWWRNGENTEYTGRGFTTQYSQLIEGRYALKVQDDSLCTSMFEIDIIPLAQELMVSLDVQDISCHGAADGMVAANISGGSLPYELFWKNSQQELPNKTSQLKISEADTLSLRVIDDKGCHAFDTASIHEPALFSFPDYFRLCNDQPYKVAAIYAEEDASFVWKADNGFNATTSEVILEKAGKYTVSALRPNGCENTQPFTVDMLDVDFMASFLGASWVEVGDTIYLKEISRPKPDSVFWDFADGLVVSIDTLGDPLISAAAPGEYEVGMYAYKDSCMTYTTQAFSFFPQGEAPDLMGEDIFGPRGIETFVIKPNPNDGRFDIDITMYTAEPVALFLYDMHGIERWRTKEDTAKPAYDIAYNGPSLEHGAYLLMAVSKSSRETLKMVVR
ncbi:MAG: hypothetical protein HC819_21175 [Cyclobacteriaceae bacterium]|nr:hypothetical protein [Cyclobacteriaceae bacterium]